MVRRGAYAVGMSQPIADGPTVSRELERPPAEVWTQLTSPDGFEHWMGPGSTIDTNSAAT